MFVKLLGDAAVDLAQTFYHVKEWSPERDFPGWPHRRIRSELGCCCL